MKSEGDYGEEEDSATLKPAKKKAIKKVENRLGYVADLTTEENDDDYNYSDQGK